MRRLFAPCAICRQNMHLTFLSYSLALWPLSRAVVSHYIYHCKMVNLNNHTVSSVESHSSSRNVSLGILYCQTD